MFKGDFGPRLDTFNAAVSAWEHRPGSLPRTDPKIIALKQGVKTACAELNPVAVQYEQSLRYMLEHATIVRQRQPLESAANWLIQVLNASNKALKQVST
jgi:hypothetical protein